VAKIAPPQGPVATARQCLHMSFSFMQCLSVTGSSYLVSWARMSSYKACTEVTCQSHIPVDPMVGPCSTCARSKYHKLQRDTVTKLGVSFRVFFGVLCFIVEFLHQSLDHLVRSLRFCQSIFNQPEQLLFIGHIVCSRLVLFAAIVLDLFALVLDLGEAQRSR
jgi:hypothetical protein